MVKEINTIVAEVLERRSLDARTCFTSVYPQPPGATTVVFECSESEVVDEVRGRVASLPGRPDVKYVVLPNGAADLPAALIAVGSVADVRREPSHESELRTQIIYGDRVEPLKSDGDWYLVRLADGYVGWIRSWHLKAVAPADLARFEAGAHHRIRTNIAQVFAEPDEDAYPVTDAVVGTVVRAEQGGKRGWRAVTFADGRTGFVRARSIEAVPAARRVVRSRLAATGMRFLGIPYLWGGATPKGFDCSGLIQRIFQLHGVLIPRDSDMQSRHGRRKPGEGLEGLRTGDLLFFGKTEGTISHVAMYLSDGLFLHAFGLVKVGSMDPAHPLFEAKLRRDWRWSCDPLS